MAKVAAARLHLAEDDVSDLDRPVVCTDWTQETVVVFVHQGVQTPSCRTELNGLVFQKYFFYHIVPFCVEPPRNFHVVIIRLILVVNWVALDINQAADDEMILVAVHVDFLIECDGGRALPFSVACHGAARGRAQ